MNESQTQDNNHNYYLPRTTDQRYDLSEEETQTIINKVRTVREESRSQAHNSNYFPQRVSELRQESNIDDCNSIRSSQVPQNSKMNHNFLTLYQKYGGEVDKINHSNVELNGEKESNSKPINSMIRISECRHSPIVAGERYGKLSSSTFGGALSSGTIVNHFSNSGIINHERERSTSPINIRVLREEIKGQPTFDAKQVSTSRSPIREIKSSNTKNSFVSHVYEEEKIHRPFVREYIEHQPYVVSIEEIRKQDVLQESLQRVIIMALENKRLQHKVRILEDTVIQQEVKIGAISKNITSNEILEGQIEIYNSQIKHYETKISEYLKERADMLKTIEKNKLTHSRQIRDLEDEIRLLAAENERLRLNQNPRDIDSKLQTLIIENERISKSNLELQSNYALLKNDYDDKIRLLQEKEEETRRIRVQLVSKDTQITQISQELERMVENADEKDEADYLELEKEIDCLQQRLLCLSSENDRLMTMIDFIKSELDIERSRNNNAGLDMRRSVEFGEKVFEENQGLNSQLEICFRKIKEKTSLINNFENERIILKDKIRALETELNVIDKTELKNALRELDQIKKENKRLNVIIIEKDKALTALNIQLKNIKEEVTEEMESKIEEFISEIKALEIENSNLQNRLEESNAALNLLERTNSQLRTDLSNHVDEIHEKDRSLISLRSKAQNMEANLLSTDQEMQRLRRKMDDKSIEHESYNDKLSRLQSEKNVLRRDKEELERKLMDANRDLADIQNRHSEINKRIIQEELEKQSLLDEISKEKADSTKLKNSLSQLEEDMRWISSDMEKLASELDRRENELESSKEELRRTMDELKIKAAENIKLQSLLNSLKGSSESNNSALISKLRGLESKLESCINENTAKSKEIEALNTSLKDSQVSLANCKVEISRLTKEIDALYLDNQQLTKGMMQRDQSIQTIEIERDHLRKDYDILLKESKEMIEKLSLEQRRLIEDNNMLCALNDEKKAEVDRLYATKDKLMLRLVAAYAELDRLINFNDNPNILKVVTTRKLG